MTILNIDCTIRLYENKYKQNIYVGADEKNFLSINMKHPSIIHSSYIQENNNIYL